MKDLIEKIQGELNRCLLSLFENQLDFPNLPQGEISLPNEIKHGHLNSTIALKGAKLLKKSPREIAGLIQGSFLLPSLVEKIEIAGPGFINFFLKKELFFSLLDTLFARGDKFGETVTEIAEKVILEFVSTNPTGPLNVVSGRAAAIGDALSSLLEWGGKQVHREFYINNVGGQIARLEASFKARVIEALGGELKLPEDGYPGEYLKGAAVKFTQLHKPVLNETGELLWPNSDRESLQDFILGEIIHHQKTVLGEFKVKFNKWFKESTLHQDGKPENIVAEALERGLAYEKEGAVFLKTSDFGDEKDRVLRKSNGALTYFANDIAYHLDKIHRGFDYLIDIWGPDHHGHIKRMECALEAFLGKKPPFEVIIAQQVNLMEGGQALKMGKRLGRTVELKDFMKEVPTDAIRYFFLDRGVTSPLDFDIELAIKQDKNNPLYYVQYAHARICQLLVKATERKIIRAGEKIPHQKEFEPFLKELEIQLIWSLSQFPGVILHSGLSREPGKLVQYLYELAGTLQFFYQNKKNPNILDRDPLEARFLLRISQAVQQVLFNGLGILHLGAPEKM